MADEAEHTAPVEQPREGTEPPAPPVEPDWKAEAEKWKTLADQTEKRAKRHEDTAKANADAAKELQKVREASMSDMEKAVAAARAEAHSEALRTVGGRLVDAEVRVALMGRAVNADALLEGLDRGRFLTDDGEPDAKAIAAWVERITPAPDPEAKPGFPGLGQGRRAGSTRPSVAAGAAMFQARQAQAPQAT